MVANKIIVTARDMAYIDISSRVLEKIMDEHPEILREAAYVGDAPDNWESLWHTVIENIRERFL